MKFEDLFAKRLARIKPGLARIQLANEQLGWIAQRTPSILVGGTNGKGTTSAFLWRLLARSRSGSVLPCGLFSSPHLVSFAERIRLSGRGVRESELEAAIPDLMANLDPELWEELSFFEASLLLAFHLWQESDSRVNVLEVGLGGRLDATNVANPVVSVITSIGLDHCEILGDTISSIAAEKAGIMRPGRPLVLGFGGPEENNSPDDSSAFKVISARAELEGAQVWSAGRDFGYSQTGFWIVDRFGSGDAIELPLPPYFNDAPDFILSNFSTAAAATYLYFGSPAGAALADGGEYSPRACLAGAFAAFSDFYGPWAPSLAGRFQLVRGRIGDDKPGRSAAPGSEPEIGTGKPAGQSLILDVCHNPHGARRCVDALTAAYGHSARLPGVVSILADKDIGGILDVLQRKLDPIVLFRVSNDRTLKVDAIPDRYRDLELCDDFQIAANMMRRLLAARMLPVDGAPWVICGSVIAVGEVLAQLDLEQFDRSIFSDPGAAFRGEIQLRVLRRCLDLASRHNDDRHGGDQGFC